MPTAGKKSKPARKPTLTSLAAEIRTLRRELARVRADLRRTQTELAAERLRAMNDRRTTTGLAAVQADLRTLFERGVIDAKGKRTSPDLPKEMTESEADVV